MKITILLNFKVVKCCGQCTDDETKLSIVLLCILLDNSVIRCCSVFYFFNSLYALLICAIFLYGLGEQNNKQTSRILYLTVSKRSSGYYNPGHHGPMIRTDSFLHPDCEFESRRRKLLHDVSEQPIRIWTYALGPICIPGQRVYPWAALSLED